MTFFHVSGKLDTQYSTSKAVGASWINDQQEQDLVVDTLRELHQMFDLDTGHVANGRRTRLWDTGLVQAVYRSFGKYQEMTVAEYLERVGVQADKGFILRVTNACKKVCDEHGLFYKVPGSAKNTYPVKIISQVLPEVVAKIRNSR